MHPGDTGMATVRSFDERLPNAEETLGLERNDQGVVTEVEFGRGEEEPTSQGARMSAVKPLR